MNSSEGSSSSQNVIQCNIWTKQTLDRLNLIFQPNSYSQNIDTLFVKLMTQEEREKSSHPSEVSSTNIMLSAGIWGLIKIFRTENVEVRRQFMRFINHLEEAEAALQKTLKINAQFPPVISQITPVNSSQYLPPDHSVTTLPIS